MFSDRYYGAAFKCVPVFYISGPNALGPVGLEINIEKADDFYCQPSYLFQHFIFYASHLPGQLYEGIAVKLMILSLCSQKAKILLLLRNMSANSKSFFLYILFQLTEQKTDEVYFCVALDEIPEEFVSDATVYFLRNTEGICPE